MRLQLFNIKSRNFYVILYSDFYLFMYRRLINHVTWSAVNHNKKSIIRHRDNEISTDRSVSWMNITRSILVKLAQKYFCAAKRPNCSWVLFFSSNQVFFLHEMPSFLLKWLMMDIKGAPNTNDIVLLLKNLLIWRGN